eukprot:2765782-Pleurochrysis_carterae.AAC.1
MHFLCHETFGGDGGKKKVSGFSQKLDKWGQGMIDISGNLIPDKGGRRWKHAVCVRRSTPVLFCYRLSHPPGDPNAFILFV